MQWVSLIKTMVMGEKYLKTFDFSRCLQCRKNNHFWKDSFVALLILSGAQTPNPQHDLYAAEHEKYDLIDIFEHW
jgi:hypothetical protein